MTPFEEIYSLAKVTIIDYKIDALARKDYDAFLTYFRSLLVSGLPEFTGCLSSLEYIMQEEEKVDSGGTPYIAQVWYFKDDFDIYEKGIIAKIVVLKWWETQIQQTVAFQPHLSERDFKQLQESQSLKQKSEYKDKLEEDIGKSISAYQLQHLSELPFFGGN